MCLIVSTSCKKENLSNYSKVETSTIKTSELKVSNNFDWKTTKNINLNLVGYANSPLLITNSKGDVIEKCMLFKDKNYTTIVTIPTYEKTIYLNYMGQIKSLELNQSEINYIFN